MPKCYFSKFFLTFNMVIVYFHNIGWRKSRDLIWGLLIKIKEYASQVHPLSLSGLNQTLNFVLLQDFHFRQRSLEEEQRKGTSDITSAVNRSTCDKFVINLIIVYKLDNFWHIWILWPQWRMDSIRKYFVQVFFAKCEITINLSRIKFQLMGTSIPFNSSFYISSFSNLVNLVFFAHWRGKVKKAKCGSGRKYQKKSWDFGRLACTLLDEI